MTCYGHISRGQGLAGDMAGNFYAYRLRILSHDAIATPVVSEGHRYPVFAPMIRKECSASRPSRR